MSISVISKLLRGFHQHATPAATPLQKAGELRPHAALWRNTVRWNQYTVSEGLKTNVDFQMKIESLYVPKISSLAIASDKTADFSDKEVSIIESSTSESPVQNTKRDKGKEKVKDTKIAENTTSENNIPEDDDLCGEKPAEFPEDENNEALAKKLNRLFNPFYQETLCFYSDDLSSCLSSSTSSASTSFFADPLWVKDENLYYESNKPEGY